MLQPFPGQSGAPGGGPHQEAPGPGVGRLPNQIPHPLKTEHGVEGEERNGGNPPVGVGSAGGDETAHGTGFGNPLLQNLAVLGLFVGQKQAGVDRLVFLPARGVDFQLPEQGVHPESAGFVGHYGHHPLPEFRIPAQGAQHAGESHGGGNRHFAAPLVELPVDGRVGEAERTADAHLTAGQQPV